MKRSRRTRDHTMTPVGSETTTTTTSTSSTIMTTQPTTTTTHIMDNRIVTRSTKNHGQVPVDPEKEEKVRTRSATNRLPTGDASSIVSGQTIDQVNSTTKKEKSENGTVADQATHKIATPGNPTKKRRKNTESKRTVEIVEVEMTNDEPTMNETLSPTASMVRPFMPHGILKLPQTVASALASAFLSHREIRDLSVTCRWMLQSLHECEIKYGVALNYHIHRTRCERPLGHEYDETAETRMLLTRLPHLFIGRLRGIRFAGANVTQANVDLLSDLYRLKDVHRLLFDSIESLESGVHVNFKLPIQLPPNLREFYLLDELAPALKDFILPPTLRIINLNTCNIRSHCLTQVAWPNQLQELWFMNDLEPMDGLVLPEGLLQLISHQYVNRPITGITLPNTLTHLDIYHWQDLNGRYRDLPFPQHLTSLCLTMDIRKDDFNLTEWTHLPSSCETFDLCLDYPLTYSSMDRLSINWSPIVIPPSVRILRVQRSVILDRKRLPHPPLDLTHTISLTSLSLDALDQIEWSLTNSVNLTQLKFFGSLHVSPFERCPLTHLTNLQLLDLECSHDWDVSHITIWSKFFPPNLVKIHFPRYFSLIQPGDTIFLDMIQAWSRTLSKTIVEGYVYLVAPANARKATGMTHQYRRYVNGEMIEQLDQTTMDFWCRPRCKTQIR